ncbi:MAG TPA: hypothetical protein PLP19_18525 [bacterium]|nr:hypothetical protein [bacterium]HPN45494.1 hypothetical protein [bacterium]
MTEKKIIITQHITANYINGNLSEQEYRDLEKLRGIDPQVELLFTMVDQCMARSGKRVKPLSTLGCSASALLDMLLPEISGGYCSARNARLFLAAIIQSADFYNLLYRKLDSYSSAQTDKTTLPEFVPLSDAELFKLVKDNAPQPGLSVVGRLARKVKEIIGLIKTGPDLYRLAFASLLIIIIASGSYFYLAGRNENVVYNSYFNKQKSPYIFTDSSLRGGGKDLPGNPAFYALLGEFKMGISYYLTGDYDEALQIFNRVLVVCGSQQTRIDSEQYRVLLRDTYFYAGLSSMALAGEKQGARNRFMQQAIVYLNSANHLVADYKLKGGDRELFFAGLALSQVGENELARQSLEAIPDTSSYTNDCQKLLQHLKSR